MKPKKEITEDVAFSRLSAACARSEHSSGQVRDRMRVWGLDSETQERVLAKLVEGRYIDDRRFCEMFVNDKIKFGRWGRRKVEAALWQKGIGSDIATPVLDAVADELYLEALLPLLRSKQRTVKGRTPYERHYKLLSYAIGRGFGIDLVKQCLNKLEDETANDMDNCINADMEELPLPE